MLKNKKNVVVVIIFLTIVTFFIIFMKTHYKKLNLGNNISIKSLEQIEEYFLNISSYTATLDVSVISNKNENKYKIQQQYSNTNITKQTVIEPTNIEGLETIYDGEKLTINNTKLNLKTIYENYNYITGNQMYLSTFIEDYKQDTSNKIEEVNDQIVLNTKIKSGNKYMNEKALYISKETLKPTKLEIKDINKNTTVYIVYKEIELNTTKNEDILAFKLDKKINNI